MRGREPRGGTIEWDAIFAGAIDWIAVKSRRRNRPSTERLGVGARVPEASQRVRAATDTTSGSMSTI
jgi:hypothetical protein